MEKSTRAGCRNLSFPLEARVVVRVIDSDNRYTDGVPSTTSELFYLVSKIVDYTINLFDHRFGQDFNLDTNFYSRNRPAGNQITGVDDWRFSRNYFSKSAFASSCFDAPAFVLNVERSVTADDGGLD